MQFQTQNIRRSSSSVDIHWSWNLGSRFAIADMWIRCWKCSLSDTCWAKCVQIVKVADACNLSPWPTFTAMVRIAINIRDNISKCPRAELHSGAPILITVYSVIQYCAIEKIDLHLHYLRYFHRTCAVVFTFTSPAQQIKLELPIPIIGRIMTFVHVISFSTGLHS